MLHFGLFFVLGADFGPDLWVDDRLFHLHVSGELGHQLTNHRLTLVTLLGFSELRQQLLDLAVIGLQDSHRIVHGASPPVALYAPLQRVNHIPGGALPQSFRR